ncbi:hypothetical protein [Frigoribacterium sp. CG_9.8]|uniref:hypothetical protein n=1 Tax=Frigoribacterium sp. CG_9.8 TaxID=2787733 RepID=UPI0018C907C9|nr:hypothetical protein [Frigoribacterium sp. CG_9.8]MBG6107651.1 uncharacterized membrane protein YjjP (DUF1212 family) [Frigoribacterium sp. CG_9.8]
MSAIPILKRILGYGGILALVIAVVGSAVGFIVGGGVGLVSALIGTAMAVFFLGITAASIVLATKVARGDLLSVAFFGIVMGAWLVKLVVFIVLIVLLKDQPWIQTQVLFLTVVVAVMGTLVVDVVVIARSRMPYVSDISLPAEAAATPDRPD